MGYTTDFIGKWKLNKKLDDDTYKLLYGLSNSRRMKRKGLDPKYGTDGEFYFDPNDLDNMGQNNNDTSIVDYNRPPCTQPSLWLQWTPTEDGMYIVWDGGEKFYDYIEWIQYLIDKILAPRGYKLNGEVEWQGEENSDMGKICIKNNKVTVKHATITFE